VLCVTSSVIQPAADCAADGPQIAAAIGPRSLDRQSCVGIDSKVHQAGVVKFRCAEGSASLAADSVASCTSVSVAIFTPAPNTTAWCWQVERGFPCSSERGRKRYQMIPDMIPSIFFLYALHAAPL